MKFKPHLYAAVQCTLYDMNISPISCLYRMGKCTLHGTLAIPLLLVCQFYRVIHARMCCVLYMWALVTILKTRQHFWKHAQLVHLRFFLFESFYLPGYHLTQMKKCVAHWIALFHSEQWIQFFHNENMIAY